MQTKLSTKGKVVVPGSLRRQLGIRAGDLLDVNVEDGRIVLTPRKKSAPRFRIGRDPITGLPVLSAGPDGPTLTSKEVARVLCP